LTVEKLKLNRKPKPTSARDFLTVATRIPNSPQKRARVPTAGADAGLPEENPRHRVAGDAPIS
jgi:hypothetical protein